MQGGERERRKRPTINRRNKRNRGNRRTRPSQLGMDQETSGEICCSHGDLNDRDGNHGPKSLKDACTDEDAFWEGLASFCDSGCRLAPLQLYVATLLLLRLNVANGLMMTIEFLACTC